MTQLFHFWVLILEKKICVHSSFIHNSKILEITQNSIKRRSDKHYVLDTEWNSTQ